MAKKTNKKTETLPTIFINRAYAFNNHPLLPEEYFDQPWTEGQPVVAIEENDSWLAQLRYEQDHKIWVLILDWSTWYESTFKPMPVNSSPTERFEFFLKTRNAALRELRLMYSDHGGEGELDYSRQSIERLERWVRDILITNYELHGPSYINPITKRDLKVITNWTYWGFQLLGGKNKSLSGGMIDVLRHVGTYLGETCIRNYKGLAWRMEINHWAPVLQNINNEWLTPFDPFKIMVLICDIYIIKGKGYLLKEWDNRLVGRDHHLKTILDIIDSYMSELS